MEFVKNELTPELLGINSINPFLGNDSSSRSVMMSSHFSQRLVNDKSTPKIIQTGLEYELAKYTFDVRMPDDGLILKIIDRYPNRIDTNTISFNPETIVIYENIHTKEIGYFSIPYYMSQHQHFGYRLKYTRAMDKLIIGQNISKDTIFAHSYSIGNNDIYQYGNSFNVAFMSVPSVSEDGIMISESALEKLEFSVFETRIIEFVTGHFPLNIYGTVNNYKCFPDIGEEIRPDGILMALRKTDTNLTPVDMSIYDTMEPDMIFDTKYYVRGGGGKVIDIKIYRDDTVSNSLSENMVSNINKYVHAMRNFHNSILQTEYELRRSHISKYGVDNLVINPAFHRLVVESMAIINKPNKKHTQKLNLLYRMAQLNEYRAVFTVEYRIKPTIGFKLTCTNGGKGVICNVVKDEHMPVDSEGNRADIVMDSIATINRMNLGRLYEQYISSAARDMRKRLIITYAYNGESKSACIKKLDAMKINTPELFSNGINYLLDFLSIICQQHYEYICALSEKDLVEYLADILTDDLFIYYPINNPKEPESIIEALEKHYPPTYGPVTYVGNSGNKVTTRRNVRIGPVYIMMLEKIADEWSAVSYGKNHHLGILATTSKSEKFTHPFHNTPVCTIGETEGRVYLGYLGRNAIAEMIDRANSPVTQKQMAWNILTAAKPTNIDTLIDRRIIPYGGAKPLQLLNHIFITAGIKITYTPEEK
jgi:DNA-directed RNA polymerase beta subunit